MNNKFTILTYRLHTKDENKVLVVGTFENDSIGDNQLSAFIGKKKLILETEEKAALTPGLRSSTGKVLTKNYFVWISLPQDWKAEKLINIINVCGGVEENTNMLSVAKLKKQARKVYKYIDTAESSATGFTVSGWYINNHDVEIQFLDENGKRYPVELESRNRTDVVCFFPENTKEEIIGFKASYKGAAPKKIRVTFDENEKHAEYTTKLRISPFGKKVNKAMLYYRQHGKKAFVLKVMNKFLKRSNLSYKQWYKNNIPSQEELQKQKNHQFQYAPKISIVVPLYKTPHKYLKEMIASIQNQTYANWELCLSDGSGKDSPLTQLLNSYEKSDNRIKVIYTGKQLQISANTNAALEIATGDFIAFADHDDLLAPNALYECVKVLNQDLETEIVYTDEDKVDMSGKEHFMPHFKTDFNIDMLRSVNYICHFFVVKREIFEKVGMLNSEFDGAQDYDFVLRCVENATNIKHVAKILYHWRAHKDSTAENPESKNYAFTAGKRAVQAHYDRLGISAVVEETEHKGLYRSKYILNEKPLISIIIPNKDHTDDLDKCISSLEKKSTYTNYEVIVVENNSTEEKTFAYYKEVQARNSKVKVIYWEGKGFNYPDINNFGVQHANGEYLLFLNNDTEIVNEECLEELLGYCMREDVGAVGARLYYEDGTIQHAGVIVGIGGVAGHAFLGFAKNDIGYFARIITAQDYSAVTAACVMIKKSVFEEVDGFDTKYAVAFNDVDLCMKIRKAGYLIVYNPYAELNHYESKSRGYEDTEEKVARFNSEVDLFKSRWGEFLEKGDPYYNTNLTLDAHDFGLR